jgi:capsular exopolysaccharide synthesis family protein
MANTALPVDSGAAAASFASSNGSAGYGSGYGYGYGYGTSTVGDSEISLVHYLQILYRRRYVVLSVFLAVLLSVALYTFTSVRLYESTVRILIERENPKVVSFQEVLEQSTLTDDYYETQYKILQSRGLARRALTSLHLWSHQQFNPPPAKGFSIRRIMGAPVALIEVPVKMVEGWFQPARQVEAPGAEETKAESSVVDRFLGNLGVSAVRYSRLVDITFRSPDPALTAKVANAVADEYVKQNLEFKFATTKEASDFLNQQLAEQRKQLEQSEQALQGYRERTDSVSLEERQNIVVQKLADLNAAVTKAKTDRIQKEAAYNQVKAVQANPNPNDSMPAILSNAFLQDQKTELAKLHRQQAQLAEKLGPRHPDMVNIGLAIQTAEAKIQSEIARVVQGMRNDYEAVLSEERGLIAALDHQKAEAQALNRRGIEYGVLHRDATANKQMFESLMQRTKETGISGELKTGNIRVVDKAEVPGGPVSPNVFNNLLIGLFGGLVLAIGLAFGVEYVDDRLKNPDELKQHLGLPFLGMVPALFDKAITSPLIDGGVPSAFAENFRSIRTNVLFSSAQEGGRVLVITSTGPGEGKTVASTNLSVALAQAGQRVLLLDADMRKPSVHEVFTFKAEPGLSNLLVGNSTASEVISECHTAGLWVMPAGSRPPNPAELLGSKRFKDLLAFLLPHFDWIIVDTPPVMAVTDASIVANIAHGVLFVVGAEMTSRRAAQSAVEQLEHAQAKFIGALLNRVDLQHNGYYYSRYYRREYSDYYASGDPPSGTTPTDSRSAAAAGVGLLGALTACMRTAGTWAAGAARAGRATFAARLDRRAKIPANPVDNWNKLL